MIDSKELQAREKQEVAAPAEHTKSGLVFTPAVDIFETEAQITLLADMPGVTTKNLNIDLRDDTLTLTGDIDPFEGPDEEEILIEYEVGKYFRQFTLSEVIDQEKIEANLNDGGAEINAAESGKSKTQKNRHKSSLT